MSEDKNKNKPAEVMQVVSQAQVDKDIQGEVDEIIAKMKADGKPLQWGVGQHLSLLWRICVLLGVPEDCRPDFKVYMASAGLGSNASQFRQSGFLKEHLKNVPTRSKMLEDY